MEQVCITINEDEALVLFNFFEQFGDTGNLSLTHAAKYIALMKISAQIDKSTAVMFKPDYSILLETARQSVAEDFKRDVPDMTKVASEL